MQNITKFVLRKPVTTVLAIVTLIFFGIMSLTNSKLELMGEMDFPMLIVQTTYGGASPEDIDELITKPIEDSLSTLDDVSGITSYSYENYGLTIIEYNYGTDTDKAYDDLKQQIDSISGDLPEDADDPNVMSLNINQQASMVLSVNNPTVTNMYNYVDDDILPYFERLSSAASISTAGGQAEYVKVELIPDKLSQYNLTQSSIVSAISAADFSVPAGTTSVGSQDLSVSTGISVDDVESLRNVPITTGTGDTIYLSDVAVIDYALEDKTAIGRYNGQDTITLSIVKTQDASALELSRAVQQQMESLMALDENLEIVIISDTSDNIISSLSSVFQTMILAVVISMAIIYLFFGDLKASLIVGSSIPIAIMGAFVFMYLAGYSLNITTMSALVLGVGMMVDNSIVVLEAAFRAQDRYNDTNGKTLREAAVDAVKTVGGSVVGGTITTCVVFLPLGMLSGMSGQMMSPLGFTVVFCMIASFVSAITVVPLTYVTFRPKENTEAPAYRIVRSLQEGYRSVVARLLNHKFLVVLTALGLFVGAIFLAGQLGMELMPSTDEGTIAITAEVRPGVNIDKVDEILLSIEEVVAADPDTDRYTAESGASTLMGGGNTVTVYLKDDRSMKTADKVKYYREALSGMQDVVISVESQTSMSTMTSSNDDYEIILVGSNLENLRQTSQNIVSELQSRSDVTGVASTLDNDAPLIKINVDPIMAAAEGLVPVQVGATVRQMLSGVEAMTMSVDGNNVSVMVEYPEDEYDTLEKVENIMLTTAVGTQVKLNNIADIRYEDSASSITRSDRQYQVTITANYTTEATASTSQDIQNEVIAKYLNEDISTQRNSTDQRMMEEIGALLQAVLIAVFLVFIVMASQFESIRYSIMVMITIPLALIGSFGLLWLFDVKISMTSMLGFLMLTGTVVNNGILYVDAVNQNRESMPLNKALIEAGATRLRPILMTTLTTVLSLIPMAIGYGDNGAMMQGLALVDAGGLAASTVLSLFMLPIFYALLTSKKDRNVVKNVPSAGYMEGKNPEEEHRRRIEEERKRRADWEYSEGETLD